MSNMDKACIFGPMAKCTKDNGWMVTNTEKEFLQTVKEKAERGYGAKGKG